MTARPPIIRAFLGSDEIHVDLFAGGGGASLGAAAATGRSPDIAINHSPEAIAMHAANHPTTRHYIESVYKVDPRRAAGGRPVALLWLSPDCTHHSKAKGGKPREQKIRGLAWAAIPWAQHCRPRVIVLENVEEWISWGPIDRVTGQPIKARRGQTFRAWRRKLESFGYVVEHRLLRACDYGAPTTRRRLFLIARCDGQAIRWPQPTHGAANTGRPERHRTAAEIIDWSIPCPSIFDRDRPLADKTLARIARGIRKYVLESARPFIVKAKTHGGGGNDAMSADEPLRTVTGSKRGEFALVAPTFVRTSMHQSNAGCAYSPEEPLRTITSDGGMAIAVPYLVHRSNGERVGQQPRIYDVRRPLGTIMGQGEKHAVCAAFLAKHYGDRSTGGWAGGSQIDLPIGVVTAQDHHSVVAAHLTKLYGTSTGSDALAPTPTVTGGGQHIGLVAAFLARYNRTGDARSVADPLGCVDTTDRYALVTVTIDGEEYAIVDIGMRMLTPRELFRAQGFPDQYVIDPVGPNGKPLTKTAQIRACGNSVPPQLATALVAANLPVRELSLEAG